MTAAFLEESITRLLGEDAVRGNVDAVLVHVHLVHNDDWDVAEFAARSILRERELQAEIERLREQVAFYRGCAEAAAEQECTG